ncbi:hypothetical protein GCK32_006810 [Trichostrongylus colubriformis]|uniref:Uncharacterized protein n=1 Tax=Trichostrongylus colubriformis TaxID=6319 RepID=A0AAN8ISR7_TRICO
MPASHPTRSLSTSASTAAPCIAHSNVIETLVDSKIAEEVEDLVLLAAEGPRGRQKADGKKRDSQVLDDGSRHGNFAEVNGKGRPRRPQAVPLSYSEGRYPQRLESAGASQEVPTAFASSAQQGLPFGRLF